MIPPSDQLRTPDTVCQPDSRSPQSDFLTGQPLSVEYQYSSIAEFVLHDGVPEDVRVQFETTKNLYLYAWFVYRFYPVVELHAYTCLELALRVRFGEEIAAGKKREGKYIPSLKALMQHAIEKEYLQNEDFLLWRRATKQRAITRTEREIWAEAERNGLDHIVIDEEQVEIKPEDCDHDYLGVLLRTMPSLRNHYAHGSKSLDKGVLGTVRLVFEIISKIFPQNNGGGAT